LLAHGCKAMLSHLPKDGSAMEQRVTLRRVVDEMVEMARTGVKPANLRA
jgi:hypothetical protein